MLRAFGWVFLGISAVLLILQVFTFTGADDARLNLVLAVLTLGCVLTAIFLFGSGPVDTSVRAAGAVGLGLAVIMILVMAFNAASGHSALTQWEYIWLFIYTFAFAALGIHLMRGRLRREV